MEYGLSTYLFVDERLSSHILDRILEAGIRRLEIFGARQHFDYRDPHHVNDVAQWFKDHDVALGGLHAPLFDDTDWGRSGGRPVSIAYLEKRHRLDSMEEIKRALEVAEKLPFRYLVLHMGLPGEEFETEKFDAALTSVEHLHIFAKERGVEILLENTPNKLSEPERLVQFIHFSHLGLKICFDTGHAHMAGGVGPAFETLKAHIVSAHVHDNGSESDDHLMPFDGGINWSEAMRAFRGAPGSPVLNLELRNLHPGRSPRLAKVREIIARLDATA